MSGSNLKYFLRPEAGPVPYDKLQRRAKDALKDVIGFLSAAVTSVQGASENSTVDTNRASRIFFVSGEPGSGKSTLYLTLKAMLSDDEDDRKKYCKGCENEIDLSTLKGAVRWLDTLDLEVAGDEGENLLGAVLVRLIDVLINKDAGSNTVLSNPCGEAIKDLEELTTDIGIAWEGNLQARAGELDPDTYSEEVMRTQRARLRVNERLKKALDDLAKNGCYGCNKHTLFVLPVDDFYLKPHASLQLLRLLRMISIPRLFFLVMGDITTVEALFVEKSLADWTAVAGPQIFATLPQRQDEALGRARELRARYLRKLLPPRQRAVIEAMDWHEALEFKPERLDAEDTLEKLLKGRKLDTPSGEAYLDAPPEPSLKDKVISNDDLDSLLTFLLCPPFSQEEKNKKEAESKAKDNSNTRVKQSPQEIALDKQRQKNVRQAREAYTALQLLDATSREIMDLWFALYELNKGNRPIEDDAPPLLSSVLDIVELVIEEQNFLNEKQQGFLLGVLPTRHYTEQEIYLDMDRLRLQPEQNTWVGQSEKDLQGESKQNTQQLWVRKHRSWKLGVNTDEGESNKDEGLFAKLPPRQTAWMVLLHDLAWKWNPERVTGNLVGKLCQALNNKPPLSDSFVEHCDTSDPNPLNDFRGWAIWRDGLNYYHFPVPDFKTFQELDRFLYIWSNGFEWLINKDAEVQRLATESEDDKIEADEVQNQVEKRNKFFSVWALAGWTVLTDKYKDFAEGGDGWFKDFADTPGTFDERFVMFKNQLEEKGIIFDHSAQKDAKINQWLKNLNEWAELKKEMAKGQEDPPDDRT